MMTTTALRRHIQRAATPKIDCGPWFTVTDTTARIAFRADRACRVAVRYAANTAFSAPTTSTSVAVTEADDFTGTVNLTGLTADTTYTYRLVVDGVTDREVGNYATPTFRTFPAAGTVSFSFAFGTCSGMSPDTTIDQDVIFERILETPARFLLHLGDTMYVDDDEPASDLLRDFRTKHRRAFSDPGDRYTAHYNRLRRLLPWFSMIDDHEIENNWDNGKTGLWVPAMQAWHEYGGRANPDPAEADENYYSFSYGDVGFFVLDQRTFRSTNTATDDGDKTILGATQLGHLQSWLLDNNAAYTFKIICSPTMASGYDTTDEDSWGGEYDTFQVPTGNNGYRTERNALWDYIDTNNISGVVIISGDNHWSGSFKTTYATRARYEFNASPMNHSRGGQVSLAADIVNGPVFFKYNSSNTFGLVTIDTSVADPTISFQLYGPAGSLGAGRLTSLALSDIDAGLV